jgi:hypothetical protein
MFLLFFLPPLVAVSARAPRKRREKKPEKSFIIKTEAKMKIMGSVRGLCPGNWDFSLPSSIVITDQFGVKLG